MVSEPISNGDRSDSSTPSTGTSEDQPVAVPRKPSWQDRLAGQRWLLRTLFHAAVLLTIFVIGIVGIGIAQRVGWIQTSGPTSDSSSGDAQVASSTADRYICPMMCTPPLSEPGRCPVCAMKLVPVTAGGGGDGLSITIEPVARRLIGIQTAKAEVGEVSQTIRTIGSIDFDESKLATISAYVAGRIEKLYADYVGVPVQQDDDLALIYSPELYSAQVEFLTAIKGGRLQRLGGSESDLSELAQEKLVELGMSEQQIADLRSRGEAERRVRIQSPLNGTVIDKYAVEGDYLDTGDPIYRVADMSTVWLMLDLYPDDAARMRFGQRVEVEVASLPGKTFSGRVAFIEPTVDPTTRTVSVRVEMLNREMELKPGDYATARVSVPAIPQEKIYDPRLAGKYISPMHPQVIRDDPGDCPVCGMDLIPTSKLGYTDQPVAKREAVTIPRDAVLLTGSNSVVYVETDPGRFEVRRVTLGPLTDDRAVILEGIRPGETVATNGNFLIDSQMQLAGNPSLLDPSKAPFYPPGPIELPDVEAIVVSGGIGQRIDEAYAAYFEIQRVLTDDQVPPPSLVQTLREALQEVVETRQLEEEPQSHLLRAQSSLDRFDGTLQGARAGFRQLSHAMLRTAAWVRGPETAEQLVHMYCPMVPGGGGDWMQSTGPLINPYWGEEMYRCGQTVADLALVSEDQAKADSEKP